MEGLGGLGGDLVRRAGQRGQGDRGRGRWRDRQSGLAYQADLPSKARSAGDPALRESASWRQRRGEQKAGERNAGSGRLAAAHFLGSAPAKVSAQRSNYPSHRCVSVCVCVEREKKESVCVTLRRLVPSPRGRQINLAAPPQADRTPRAPSCCQGGHHSQPMRTARGRAEPAPPRQGKIGLGFQPGTGSSRVPQLHAIGRGRRDAARRSSPTLPWAPQPLMPRGPSVPVPLCNRRETFRGPEGPGRSRHHQRVPEAAGAPSLRPGGSTAAVPLLLRKAETRGPQPAGPPSPPRKPGRASGAGLGR